MILHAGLAGGVGSISMKCVPVLAFILAALPAFAGEFVVLPSGMQLRADRHEPGGPQPRPVQTGRGVEGPAQPLPGGESAGPHRPPRAASSAFSAASD